jgi:HK97 family phage prohead protease
MSYIITDIDGTLTTSGDTPNQPFIDWLKSQANDFGAEVIIVSARNIDRLAETERWLNDNLVPYEEIYLQDFGETNPAVNEAFKAYKYSKLQEEYGDEIAFLVDNDAEARDAAEGMGIPAYTPDEAIALTVDDGEDEDEMRILIDVPQYIQEAAEKGLTYQRNGYAGDGLTDQTIEEARQLRAGQVEDDKVTRMRAWILRHRGDWEGVPRNNNSDDEDFPGPGAVAAYLWGVDPTAENGTDRVLQWADGVLAPLDTEERFDVKELETRAISMGDYRVEDAEDGQKRISGYAALFNTPSAGLPFTEVIAPGAFKRTLSRVADGKKFVAFLFGHDETRALATTASGRLTLVEDERGLKVEALLDPADPDAASVLSKVRNEASSMGWSFGFTIPARGDSWNEDERTLREVNLFEVSVLSAGQTPAYPATLGLTSVRKVASRMGVDGDRLISAIESIKAAQPLTAEDVEVIESVTEKLAPKREMTDPSVARAKLLLAEMESESL